MQFLLVTIAFLASATTAQDDLSHYLTFESRPDLLPPKLTVTVREDGVKDGYILMSPYRTLPDQNTATIYDMNGDLVWSAFDLTGGSSVFDFHQCWYNNTPHLCYLVGYQNLGYARGHMAILDDTLSIVKQVKPQFGLAGLDQHETRLSYDRKSALVESYNSERWDLSAFSVTTGQGWVQDAVFQRINIDSGALEFEWSALENVPLSDSYVLPNTTNIVGTGFSSFSPWDYFHINSMDENADGDYLISARHVNTIYKVNGSSGDIIWRLGGKSSDFAFAEGLNFSSQHDARWMESNSSVDIISILDNASNGYTMSANHSQGMILKLDHTTDPPSASLLRAFHPPDDQHMSDSQGNVQVMDPSNWQTSTTFVSWGNVPAVNEFDSEGNIIYAASIYINTFDGPMNYRAYKVNLDTSPLDAPALFTYAKTTESSTVYYMSWNGATRVKQWRIYGKSACDDGWTLAGNTSKTGFETTFTADSYYDFGLVEACYANGTGIRNSTIKGIKTFVPGPLLAGSCSDTGCGVATGYVEPDLETLGIPETRPGCYANLTAAAAAQEASSGSSNSGSGNGGGSGGGDVEAGSQGSNTDNVASSLVAYSTMQYSVYFAGFAMLLVFLV